MLYLWRAIIAVCWIAFVPIASSALTAGQVMKGERYQKLANSTKDVKGNLSCYSCSSLVGDDCWMANTSRDAGARYPSLTSIHDDSLLMASGSFDLPSFSKPSPPFMQQSSSVSDETQSMPVMECSPDERYCMVTRVEYSKAELHSPQRFFWALERRCASTCLDGCIAIGDGERTRLYLCMSCCTDSLCNISDMAVRMHHSFQLMTLLVSLVITGTHPAGNLLSSL